ncbi:MAG: TerD family protein, partial [Mycobacteriales bacterium]
MSVALVSGANCPLGADRVVVEIRCPAPLDVSALKLGTDGKVRDDSDFVFYNQPTAAGVEHRAEGGDGPGAVVIDVAALDVEHVAVVASLDGEGTFGAAGPVEVAVRDAGTGGTLVTFTPAGLTDETAIIAVEVYARGGVWKVRAVGQGYDAGLAGVAVDFGVEVADTPHDAADTAAEPAAGAAAGSAATAPAEPTAAPPA